MWRTEGVLVLVVGAHTVSCAAWPRSRRGPPVRIATQPITPGEAESPEAAMLRTIAAAAAALGGAPHAAPRRRLRVLVSERWIALASIAWSEALLSSTSRERCARDGLEAAGFAPAPADVVRIDSSAAFGRPCLAAAYPAPLLARLHDAGAALGARLETLQPIESVLVEAARARLGRGRHGLALVDRERLRFMTVGPDGVSAGQALVDPALPADRAAVLGTLWRRQQLRAPELGRSDAPPQVLDLNETDPGGVLQLLRAARQADPFAALSGVAAPPRPAPAAWIVGAACLGMAALLAMQALRIADQARALEQHAVAAAPAAAPRASWTRDELVRVQAVNAAIRELNLPIADLLRALQPPRDIRVALLGIAVEPAAAADSTVRLKLHAESASGAEMARYVGHLSGRAPLRRAYLVNHRVDAADAAFPYRFDVELAWQE